MTKLYRVVSIALLMTIFSCVQNDGKKMTEKQLTFGNEGHTIHNTQVFSPNDEWIVFDSRNHENQIPSTEFVKMVNVNTQEIKVLYQVPNQTEFGPGVGAATFSTTRERVLFIRGLLSCAESNPYSFTRRTGVAIDIEKPQNPIHLDARDISSPYTPGAHRGGSHAHTWSGDGMRVSFTYNDKIMENLAVHDSSFRDLRTLGVMFPQAVEVKQEDGIESFGGEMFTAIVARVSEKPTPGSDEIDKAYDEGWIGKDGYVNAEGKHVRYAIAFQGDVIDNNGERKSEVFVVDLPDDMSWMTGETRLEGTDYSRMEIPVGVQQRRVTYTTKGICGPRHWLRTNPEGSLIAFLSEDDNGIIQLFAVSPNGGVIQQITFSSNSIQSPFNFSPDGNFIAYFADDAVKIVNLSTYEESVISQVHQPGILTGAPVWSNNGSAVAYNKYIDGFVQIFMIEF